MMTRLADILSILQAQYPQAIIESIFAQDELTLILQPDALLDIAWMLRDDPALAFEQCIDVCGVDYLHYGVSEWQVAKATSNGFDRGVERNTELQRQGPRFAVVYHLLSLTHNLRLRLKVFVPEKPMLSIASLTEVWPSVNWFEREAFDLFGILFVNHPDLRRILTDYGFIGHPFRKDFPVHGQVEVRYDAAQARVVYEPVSIEPRVLVSKVIRTKV